MKKIMLMLVFVSGNAMMHGSAQDEKPPVGIPSQALIVRMLGDIADRAKYEYDQNPNFDNLLNWQRAEGNYELAKESSNKAQAAEADMVDDELSQEASFASSSSSSAQQGQKRTREEREDQEQDENVSNGKRQR